MEDQIGIFVCKKELRSNKMAIAIKSVPVLEGNIAKSFIKKADANLSKKSTVDFSKEVAIANKILSKAKKPLASL